MILEEYDENLHISNEKEISYQEGLEQGRKEEQENTLRERQRADQASQQAKEANQRAAVFQLKVQGKSEKEIAEAMNLPFEKVQEILNFC